MAREYAKVFVSIWDDPDFLALSPTAQGLYFRLLTDATLSMCGVADWRPNRIAKSSVGSTASTVRAAGAELEDHQFIVTDEDTEEVLIRSFVRHDGVLKSPNMVKAMVSAWRGTGSHKIKAVVSQEIRKGFAEVSEPFRKGSREVPEDIQNFEWNPSLNPSEEVPSDLPPGSPILQPATSTQKKNRSTSSELDGDFIKFWSVYPRRVGKGQAVKAWAKAAKKVDPDSIIAAAEEYARETAGKDAEFIAHPATWLNGERWADEKPQQRRLESVVEYRDEEAPAPETLPWLREGA